MEGCQRRAFSGCGRWQWEASLPRLPSSHQSQRGLQSTFSLNLFALFQKFNKVKSENFTTCEALIFSPVYSYTRSGCCPKYLVTSSSRFSFSDEVEQIAGTQVRDGEASFSPPTTPSIEFHSLDSLGEEALTYQGLTLSYICFLTPAGILPDQKLWSRALQEIRYFIQFKRN